MNQKYRKGITGIVFIRAALIAAKIQKMTEEKRKTEDIHGHFVLCDVQKEYSENLRQVWVDRFQGTCPDHIFKELEKLKLFSGTSEIEILLIAEEYGEEQIKSAGSGRIFIISEKRKGRENDGMNYIFRYQSAEKIIEEIFPSNKSCVKKQRPRIRDEPVGNGIIGIYSPVHRIGKTRLALRYGRQLAVRAPALYLNLEGCSGGNYYFSDACGYDMGDLLYYVRQDGASQGIRISIMTDQTQGLDYIFPMKNEVDFRAVKGEEWIALLETIKKKCIYDSIILDLGDSINGLYDILRKCDRIYTPYTEDGVSAAKIEQYEKNLDQAGYGDILNRTVKKKMKKGKLSDEKNGGINGADRISL